MPQQWKGIEELASRLRSELGAEPAEREGVALSRDEVSSLLAFVEKSAAVAERAQALLTNAYSVPDDERGMRFHSEDAVRLQWALREIGVGDDSGEPCFTV